MIQISTIKETTPETKEQGDGNSLAVQSLGLHGLSAAGPGQIPGQGAVSPLFHTVQPYPSLPQKRQNKSTKNKVEWIVQDSLVFLLSFYFR